VCVSVCAGNLFRQGYAPKNQNVARVTSLEKET